MTEDVITDPEYVSRLGEVEGIDPLPPEDTEVTEERRRLIRAENERRDALETRVTRLAADCRAWGAADPETHALTARARRAATVMAVMLPGRTIPDVEPENDVEELADRAGVLWRELVDEGMLRQARAVNHAWAELTAVDG